MGFWVFVHVIFRNALPPSAVQEKDKSGKCLPVHGARGHKGTHMLVTGRSSCLARSRFVWKSVPNTSLVFYRTHKVSPRCLHPSCPMHYSCPLPPHSLLLQVNSGWIFSFSSNILIHSWWENFSPSVLTSLQSRTALSSACKRDLTGTICVVATPFLWCCSTSHSVFW